MAHLLVECTHLLASLAHRVSLLRLVANQVAIYVEIDQHLGAFVD
jgi:hypothetical protein